MGKPNGMQFGVGDGIPNHPSRRYAGNFEKSLRLQAEWAAGTIKKRYNGNLEIFARRYCPPNWKSWTENVRFYMGKVADIKQVEIVKSEDENSLGYIDDGFEDADTINKR